MRKRAKADANQEQIVKDLRKLGCSVQPIHSVGNGCPDILVGWRGECFVFELKNGDRPCDRVLTPDESKWHREWRGQVKVAGTTREIAEYLGITGVK